VIAKRTDNELRRSHRRRVLLFLFVTFAVGWALLEAMRLWAERRAIPVEVAVDGPPPGFAVRFPGMPTNNLIHRVSYEEVSHPLVSRADIAAMRHCLARERFLPLFPAEIEIGKNEVVARYRMRTNRRTGRLRETVVTFTHETTSWHIQRIEQSSGRAGFVRPPTLLGQIS
jgi:hypothetical protein